MDLNEIVNEISNREDLVQFLRNLRKDFSNSPEQWPNDRLDLFLEAMEASIADLDGYFENRGEPVPSLPSWKLIGEIILAAKYYE